jgi:hypothetical protein
MTFMEFCCCSLLCCVVLWFFVKSRETLHRRQKSNKPIARAERAPWQNSSTRDCTNSRRVRRRRRRRDANPCARCVRQRRPAKHLSAQPRSAPSHSQRNKHNPTKANGDHRHRLSQHRSTKKTKMCFVVRQLTTEEAMRDARCRAGVGDARNVDTQRRSSARRCDNDDDDATDDEDDEATKTSDAGATPRAAPTAAARGTTHRQRLSHRRKQTRTCAARHQSAL